MGTHLHGGRRLLSYWQAVVFDNEINAKRVTEKNFHLFKAVIDGYSDALAKTGLVNITGEVAIMKHCITAFCDASDDSQLILTWGASCVGLCDKDKLLSPTNITDDMAVVALPEEGYRCNGGTFFTNIILSKWGADARKLFDNTEARAFVRKLTVPSVCYTPFMLELTGWKSVHWGESGQPEIIAGAHITGGGIMKKFCEMLPAGVGAELGTMPEPPEVLKEAQDYSQGTPYRLSDWEAHRTLHGGCGMLLVTTKRSVPAILERSKHWGIRAVEVGSTTKSPKSEVLINSRFLKGGTISSLCPE